MVGGERVKSSPFKSVNGWILPLLFHGGVLGDGVLGLTLGAHKADILARGHNLLNEALSQEQTFQGLADIDDVNFVALAKDEASHFRIPVGAALAEVNSGINEGLNSRHWHQAFLVQRHRRGMVVNPRWRHVRPRALQGCPEGRFEMAPPKVTTTDGEFEIVAKSSVL